MGCHPRFNGDSPLSSESDPGVGVGKQCRSFLYLPDVKFLEGDRLLTKLIGEADTHFFSIQMGMDDQSQRPVLHSFQGLSGGFLVTGRPDSHPRLDLGFDRLRLSLDVQMEHGPDHPDQCRRPDQYFLHSFPSPCTPW